jgi:hypothetical protein
MMKKEYLEPGARARKAGRKFEISNLKFQIKLTPIPNTPHSKCGGQCMVPET